jgi:alkylated DNA repair dioxygenase AlkB
MEEEPLLLEILEVVNKKLSTMFNSVLVNFYQDSETILPYHKDDEKKLDKTVPIAT